MARLSDEEIELRRDYAANDFELAAKIDSSA